MRSFLLIGIGFGSNRSSSHIGRFDSYMSMKNKSGREKSKRSQGIFTISNSISFFNAEWKQLNGITKFEIYKKEIILSKNKLIYLTEG